MPTSTTRGRSFTDFPRNTKERHVRTCAMEAREQQRREAEVEACYDEWEPVQTHKQGEMDLADFYAWDLNNIEEGWYPGVGVTREFSVYQRGELKRVCGKELGHV